MKIEILEALREHGELYADEIAQGQGVIVDALRQLADDFQIYQEQVRHDREILMWFLWTSVIIAATKLKQFTRENSHRRSVFEVGREDKKIGVTKSVSDAESL